MTFETIITMVIAAAPAILSTVAVAVISALTKKFTMAKIEEAIYHVESASAEIKSSKEYTELKQQLVVVHQENVQLKKKLNETLTKIDRISRSEE
jgi:methylthioribose-1-phosphate isomerase